MPSSELAGMLDVLGSIERLLGTMHNEAPPSVPAERTIKSLVAAVAKLSQPKKPRPAKCPTNYIDMWNRTGVNGVSEIPNRAIRYLSWETDIAVTPEFQTVALRPDRISSRSLQGLVRSQHRRWCAVATKDRIAKLANAVMTYDGKNVLIQKWKDGLQYILNLNGPEYFAKDIIESGTSWERVADEWGLEPGSEFGHQVLERCISVSLAGSFDSEKLQAVVIRNVLPSRHWTPASLKLAVQQLILASDHSSQEHCEKIKMFILTDSRLLDPRLPANVPNWIGISDKARDLVIQWLSAEDIELFFDHVLPHRSDPHGRKPFWMKYKSKIKRSRSLLSYLDERRWQANAATKTKHNFGRMEYFSDTSAFLLDFGPVLVVEFSKVGNAVYIYRHRDIPGLDERFWSAAPFPIRELKQPDNCVDKLTHNVHWQSRMRTLLAQFGVHPGA